MLCSHSTLAYRSTWVRVQDPFKQWQGQALALRLLSRVSSRAEKWLCLTCHSGSTCTDEDVCYHVNGKSDNKTHSRKHSYTKNKTINGSWAYLYVALADGAGVRFLTDLTLLDLVQLHKLDLTEGLSKSLVDFPVDVLKLYLLMVLPLPLDRRSGFIPFFVISQHLLILNGHELSHLIALFKVFQLHPPITVSAEHSLDLYRRKTTLTRQFCYDQGFQQTHQALLHEEEGFDFLPVHETTVVPLDAYRSQMLYIPFYFVTSPTLCELVQCLQIKVVKHLEILPINDAP